MKKLFLIASLLLLTASSCEADMQQSCCEEYVEDMIKYSDYATGVSGDSDTWTAKAEPDTTPSANDGFGWEPGFPNDFLGFSQAATKAAGVQPNDTIETADSSQIFQALMDSIRRSDFYNAVGGGAFYALTPITGQAPLNLQSVTPTNKVGTQVTFIAPADNEVEVFRVNDSVGYGVNVSNRVLEDGETASIGLGELSEGSLVRLTLLTTPDGTLAYWMLTPDTLGTYQQVELLGHVGTGAGVPSPNAVYKTRIYVKWPFKLSWTPTQSDVNVTGVSGGSMGSDTAIGEQSWESIGSVVVNNVTRDGVLLVIDDCSINSSVTWKNELVQSYLSTGVVTVRKP